MAQGADLSFQLPKKTVVETETYKIVTDGFGATTRVFKGQESVPETMDFTITSRRAWEEHKPRMAWNDSRVGWEGGLKANRTYRERGLFVTFQAGCSGLETHPALRRRAAHPGGDARRPPPG